MSWIREANAEPIPGYRLIQPLGSGGFGEVWKCEAPGGLFKAIKFVYGSLNSLDVEGVRAEQEWKALQRIKEVRHPFVCSVERIDNVQGELVIVMELAERTLHDLFQEHQSAGLIGVPRDDLLRYLRDAAEALDYMNVKHNLQHLDVKPRNLFIIGDRVKVADFGLVKHLQSQGVSGPLGGVTPLYAPPETLVGKISPHSDQYSLAIVYQEMLTGHRPFVAKNIRMLAQMHMQNEPDLRALPESDRPILARALAKDPAERFADCLAFIGALFKARSPVKVGAHGAGANRPKSIADTMEDILLVARERNSSVEIDLAAPPPPHPVAVPRGEGDDESEEENLEVCEQGLTVVQPETGVLRPTLIIGLGHFGRKALLELRCRFLDRLGDLHKLPLLRFLCIDTDPEAVNTAIRGAPEVALTRAEVHHLALQPVGNYRRRSLEHLSEWLPREKLYAMPRSLQTQGSRALGRLAFAENQQRLIARLRRDLQEITRPENLFESVNQTGLALCNSTPRVYVIAAAGGGTSGLLPDLGYALRRLLGHLRHPDARVTAFVFGGAMQDPATPKSELANVYATLTELNHFSDPEVTFTAQYGPEGQRLVDEGAPFHSVYLLPLAHRSPDALDETVAHLGSYLFHELTTPVGLRLDQLRMADQFGDAGPAAGALSVPVRSFGTYAVWFPRGLLLHLAARQACRRLTETWVAADTTELTPEVCSAIERTVRNFTELPDLTPKAIAKRIEQLAQAGTPTDAGTTPGEVLAGVLAKLEEQALQPVAQTDPGNWARQALGRVREWVGTPGEGDGEYNEWRKARMARVLVAAAQKLAEDFDQQLSKEAMELLSHPGARLAAAETALSRLQQHFAGAAEAMNTALAQHASRTLQAHRLTEEATQECIKGGSGYLFFGGRSRGRQLRYFLDQLGAFAHLRLKEEQTAAARQCLLALAGRFAERLRDLGFCRQRIRHLQQNLEQGPADPDEDLASTRPGSEFTLSRSPLPAIDSFWQAIRQSSTARVVLPEGAEDLEQAALRFLQQMHSDHWTLLDKELHDLVLAPRGGLHGACVAGGDLTRQLAAPLLEEASKYLGKLLPQVDVAQILTSEVTGAEGAPLPPDSTVLKEQTTHYLERAKPLLTRKEGSGEDNLLLIPASAAGKQLGEAIAGLFQKVHCVRVPGQADLMFLREQSSLSAADLRPVLRASKAAYEAVCGAPVTSPHARFDLTDWLPLEP
jgi:eukaryotic-like serine/threonine-protein kinase